MISFYIMKRITKSIYFKVTFGCGLLSCAILFMVILLDNRPMLMSSLNVSYKVDVKFPTNLVEVKDIVKVFSSYKEKHGGYVLLLFCTAFVFKQSFAIPGSFLLNITAGALFGVTNAFLLVCTLTAMGATFCYLMSRYFGKQLIETYFPVRLNQLRTLIEANKESLFFYLLFLRLFPMSPNWLLNVTSPLINVPIHYFFLSVFIGLMPYNYICVQTGNILSELTSLDSVFTPSIILKMLLAAVAALLPCVILKYSKYRQRFLLPNGTIVPLSQEIILE